MVVLTIKLVLDYLGLDCFLIFNIINNIVILTWFDYVSATVENSARSESVSHY